MKPPPQDLTETERAVLTGFARRMADEAGFYEYHYAWLPDDLIAPTAKHLGLSPERVQELYRMCLDWLDIPPEQRLPPNDPRHDEEELPPIVAEAPPQPSIGFSWDQWPTGR